MQNAARMRTHALDLDLRRGADMDSGFLLKGGESCWVACCKDLIDDIGRTCETFLISESIDSSSELPRGRLGDGPGSLVDQSDARSST